MYTLHMDLYNDVTGCQQNLTVTDLDGNFLQTFNCETPVKISNDIFEQSYIKIELSNSAEPSNGHFWLGFEARESGASVTVACPAATTTSSPTNTTSPTTTTKTTITTSPTTTTARRTIASPTTTIFATTTSSSSTRISATTITSPTSITSPTTSTSPKTTTSATTTTSPTTTASTTTTTSPTSTTSSTTTTSTATTILHTTTTSPTTTGRIPSEGMTVIATSACTENQTLTAKCPSGRIIAVTDISVAFKLNNDSNCYGDAKDCKEPAKIDDNFLREFIGRTDGTGTGSYQLAAGVCATMGYNAISKYTNLTYQCINETIIHEMCDDVSYTSQTDRALYLWNRGYPESGILDTDKSCACSVTASSATSDIVMYIIHMDLYNDFIDCQQNLSVTNNIGQTLHIFNCTTPEFASTSLTFPYPYVKIHLSNMAASPNGRFWIGLQATESWANIFIVCSTSEKIDCSTPDSGSYSTVTSSSGLKHGSVAEYTCFNNYTRLSGNEQRYCIENGMWNGTALNCIYECGAPEPPVDGNVRFDKTVTGEQANYSCADNYTLFGNEARVCVDDLGWNGSAPSCLKDCASLSVLENGNVVLIGSGSAGTVAVFTCNEGYSLIGPTLLTCLQDTVWSDDQPECKITGTSSTSADITIVLSVTIPIILILLTVLVVHILYYRGAFNKGNSTTDKRGTPPCSISKLNIHLAEINLSNINSSRAYQHVEEQNNGAIYNARDEIVSLHYYEHLTEKCADQPYEELRNEDWKSQTAAAL